MIHHQPDQQLCDDDELIAVLRDGEDAAEHKDVVEHIEQCPRCQKRFDELAAGAQDWSKARQAILNDDPCPENRVGSAKWDYSLRNEGPVAWTESMASQLLSPASHPELLGRLGRYDVERLIGSGGMGIVFKAHDSELNRPVAIKILAPYLSSSGPARKRFAREARAAAAVVHEHVVPIYNVETDRETPFLVMHYIAGESLQGRIDREGGLELCEILRIGMQVASGLSAAHQQGLVHRDIKPSNILMEQGVERALITDFGLARAADDASLTRTGFHPGTPQYMSPEQAAGEQVDARSDLFSLGSVLYTMCTGRPPFRAETSLGVLRRITDVEPRPIREINPTIPDWLCSIISKLMAKKADDRFASAMEVAELLEDCLAHVQQPSTARLPEGLLEKPGSRLSTIRLRKFGVYAMLAVVSSFVLSMLLMQPPEKTPQDDVPATATQAEDVVTKQVFPAEVVNEVHIEHSQPLFGVWTVEKIVSSGEVVPADKAPGEIEFRGNQMIWKRTGKTAGADKVFEFELDMSKSPHWLTFRSQDPKRPQPVLALLDTSGRYQSYQELGNSPGAEEQLPQLRIFSLRDADGNPSAERPTQIGTGEEPGTDLIVLKLKSPFIDTMQVYPIGDAISDSLFVDIPTINAESPASEMVKAKIAAEADLLVKQIEKSFGPCNLIDFDPSSMALVIDHNASAHDKISQFLQLRAPSAKKPIRLSVIGVSSEWMAEKHQEQFERWFGNAKTLSSEEVANVRSWQSTFLQTVGNDVQLTAGKPYTYTPKHSRIPVTIMARHLAQQDSECGMLQVRLDMSGTDGSRTSVVGSLSLDDSGSGLVLHQHGSDNFFWLVVPLFEAHKSN
ncbi:serine/threonine-protein kinase [Stieleria varia]|uniref:non-specific serine/threonine protein kinase n=1 Tax=Stieleria varia TaxID=2528005 RepID=A0A5C6B8R8_9BACT|nr:serine/threonine-protein kinase [Stieleria varia]TWU07841.1 Serine/threonine-protein kinase PrkC [Stieleria varia]